MNKRHRCAGLGKPIGRLQSEQPAADHDDALSRSRQRQQQVDVPAVAKRIHSLEFGARHVEPQRHRARGKDQLRKRDALGIGDLEFAATDIDLGDGAAVFQCHAAIAPPVGGPEFDIVRGGIASQHRRQQHAIIGKPRLVADDGNGVAAERGLGEFIDQAGRRHSVAHDHQRFAHGVSPIRPPEDCRRPRRS